MGDDCEIRWTTHGVAHVRADDWAGVGHGQGYACARDHLPAIADQVVKVRGERARWFGAGPDGGHLAGDLGYRMLDVAGRAVRLRDAQPAHVRELVSGYVRGVNRRIAEVGEQPGLLPEWCRGAPWIRPLEELDLYAHLVDVTLMGSGRNLVGLIGRAEAPGPEGPVPPAPMSALGGPDYASNGWAVGGDVTASGHGMVLANPHFPWYGEARFWECHLTIPGELDVYGVSLLGVPGVQIGFTEGVAWTHTFSRGHRFTLYRLELVAGSPTRYRFGDDERDMEPTTVSAVVARPDGSSETVERTLWSTHHGPVVNLPLLGWGTEVAFAYRDANIEVDSTLRQFVGMDLSRDLDELTAVFESEQGIPWANTMAADRSGRVWYCDASSTPALSDGAQQRFAERVRDDFVAQLLFANRIALLDGSDPDDDWVDHRGARAPGVEPWDHLPRLTRRDVVTNANDSHWLTHPEEPLEGYNVLCGFERTGRSLRTRQNVRRAAELSARGHVTLDDLLEAVFDNASLSAELLLEAVVARCRDAGRVTVEGHDADLALAADVLERWDRTCRLDSRGAVLWREFMAGFTEDQWRGAPGLFAEGFDPDRPVATPSGLVTAPEDGEDPVQHAMGHAMRVLDAAGVAPDAVLAEVQWAARGDGRVPVHGGGEGEGMLNVLAPVGALPAASLEPSPSAPMVIPGRERTGLGEGGYQVSYGTSYVMAVELTEAGPVGRGLLAYGQSGDPRSPHHHDGTDAYASGAARPLLFRDAEIEADPELVRIRLTDEAGGP